VENKSKHEKVIFVYSFSQNGSSINFFKNSTAALKFCFQQIVLPRKGMAFWQKQPQQNFKDNMIFQFDFIV